MPNGWPKPKGEISWSERDPYITFYRIEEEIFNHFSLC